MLRTLNQHNQGLTEANWKVRHSFWFAIVNFWMYSFLWFHNITQWSSQTGFTRIRPSVSDRHHLGDSRSRVQKPHNDQKAAPGVDDSPVQQENSLRKWEHTGTTPCSRSSAFTRKDKRCWGRRRVALAIIQPDTRPLSSAGLGTWVGSCHRRG